MSSGHDRKVVQAFWRGHNNLEKLVWAQAEHRPEKVVHAIKVILQSGYHRYSRVLEGFDPTYDTVSAQLFACLVNRAAKNRQMPHRRRLYAFKPFCIWYAVRRGCYAAYGQDHKDGSPLWCVWSEQLGAFYYHDPKNQLKYRLRDEERWVKGMRLVSPRRGIHYEPGVPRFVIRAMIDAYKRHQNGQSFAWHDYQSRLPPPGLVALWSKRRRKRR